MIKYNQGNLYFHLWTFNKYITNVRSTGVENHTINYGSNTSAGTDICYDIHLYFDIGFYVEAWGLFKHSQSNGPGCTSIYINDILQTELLLLTLVLLLK